MNSTRTAPPLLSLEQWDRYLQRLDTLEAERNHWRGQARSWAVVAGFQVFLAFAIPAFVVSRFCS